jgi:hypothetical protein
VPDVSPIRAFFRFQRLSASQAEALAEHLGDLKVAARADKDGLAGWIPLLAETSPAPVVAALRSVHVPADSYGVLVSCVGEGETDTIRLPTWVVDFAATVRCPIDVAYTIV